MLQHMLLWSNSVEHWALTRSKQCIIHKLTQTFSNKSLYTFYSPTWISGAFEKKRKITCNNLSLQSCGDTALVFLYLSLSASRLRIWEDGRENESSGLGRRGWSGRGRRVWRKRWIMWLRIMSKKLHKAFSQITYQLGGWHCPWSISSVLDLVPHRSAVQVHVRPHTRTYAATASH